LGPYWCNIVVLPGMPARNTLEQLLAVYTNPASHNAQRHRQTDRQTDKQTDGQQDDANSRSYSTNSSTIGYLIIIFFKNSIIFQHCIFWIMGRSSNKVQEYRRREYGHGRLPPDHSDGQYLPIWHWHKFRPVQIQVRVLIYFCFCWFRIPLNFYTHFLYFL